MDTFEDLRDFAWPAKEEIIQSDCSGEYLESFVSDAVAWRVVLDDMSHGEVEALLKSVKGSNSVDLVGFVGWIEFRWLLKD